MPSGNDDQKTDWLVLFFIFIALPAAFTLGGIWVGFMVLVIGVIALGWSKRHNGPFPTNKNQK